MWSYYPFCYFVQLQSHDHWVLGFSPFGQASLAPVNHPLQKADQTYPALSLPKSFLPCGPCMCCFFCLENSPPCQHQLFHQVINWNIASSEMLFLSFALMEIPYHSLLWPGVLFLLSVIIIRNYKLIVFRIRWLKGASLCLLTSVHPAPARSWTQ